MDNTHSPKRLLAKNTVFSVIAWSFPIIIGFVATPILVKGLGAEQYGIFALVLGFLSYSFTFGIGKVASKFIPEYKSAGQDKKLFQIVSATFWFSLLIATVGSLAVALSARYVVSDILLITSEAQQTATIALYLACATGFALMVSQTFQFTLQGLHLFGSYLLLTNLNGILLGLGNIILVLNGFGVAALLTWNLFVAILIGVLFYLQARRNLPHFAITFSIDRQIFNSVLKYGGNIILFQIFANVLYIFERTWIVRKFGAQQLTFYFVPMLLALYLQGLVSSLVQALFPRLNELLSAPEKIAALYQKAMKVVLAVVVFVSTAFIVAGKMFLTLWVNADFAANSYYFLAIHSLTFSLISLAILSVMVAEAFRFSSLTAMLTFAWMVITIPLMIFTSDVWGSEGVALSRLAATVITFPLVFHVENKFLGGVLWKFWLAASIRIGLATLAIVLIASQLFYRLSESWFTLVLGITLCGLIFCGLLYIFGFLSRDEKDMIRQLILKDKKVDFSVNS